MELTFTPRDESAALQWAIENFRNNAYKLKDNNLPAKRAAYNKELLMLMKNTVETIPRGDALSIVVPESSEQLHRIDEDELVDLVTEAREEIASHKYPTSGRRRAYRERPFST